MTRDHRYHLWAAFSGMKLHIPLPPCAWMYHFPYEFYPYSVSIYRWYTYCFCRYISLPWLVNHCSYYRYAFCYTHYRGLFFEPSYCWKISQYTCAYHFLDTICGRAFYGYFWVLSWCTSLPLMHGIIQFYRSLYSRTGNINP